ncbi:helix-turn-helix domain-containing protein [Aestuariispira ectoiniformans]|uniref:helix-turn-helix domain-containing protein n=1 Tax=Aestuariispira ectoiniformans TaxID=2775080 RepID=UPI00223A7148|nr:helix-turn-helix domain-containing protein [Aestuariispira ectoiniformans]
MFFHMIAAFAEARKRGAQLGHKKKLTPAMMKEAVDLLCEGYSYEGIAEKWKGKISKSTLYNYREQTEAFIPLGVEDAETNSK